MGLHLVEEVEGCKMTDYEKLLVIVHNDPLHQADGIVLLEGDGFSRIAHAAELYKAGYAPKVIFSGGITDYGYGSYPFEECLPLLIEAGVKPDDIVAETRSRHTAEQALYVPQLARQNGWRRLILVATPHHQCRAYLTFLKTVGRDLILMNSVAPIESWYDNAGWGARFDLLEQEQKRIETYTAKGDLVGVTEALEYQKWKEEQLRK